MDKPATSPPDSTPAPRGAEHSDPPAAQAQAPVSQLDAPGSAGSGGDEDDEDDENDEYVPL